jgi:SAM-dependent methyltransferase
VGVDLFPPADVLASAEKPLPFGDDSFEVVVFADVLEHLDDPHGALDEGLRIARQVVVVLLPNLYTAWNRLYFARGRLYGGKYALGVEPTLDRHRWFLRFDEARAFVRGRADRAGWAVSREIAHTPAFRHPGMLTTYWLARRVGGPNLWSWEYAARLEGAGRAGDMSDGVRPQ